MFCPNCGTSVENDSTFCHMCGAKIGSGVKAAKSPKPVDGAKASKGKGKLALVILGLMIVAAGVFVMIAYPCVIVGHDWWGANCLTPKTCSVCWETEGEPLPHRWEDATCSTPKTCSLCATTEGLPLSHQWKAATCSAPKTCALCGETVGGARGHNWIEATETSPRRCLNCNSMQPLPRPETGEIFIGKDKTRSSTLLVENGSDLDYYGILKNAEYESVYSFYVRANESKHISVPSGEFYLFYSQGTDWYGPEYYFGEGTEPISNYELKDFNKYWWTTTTS